MQWVTLDHPAQRGSGDQSCTGDPRVTTPMSYYFSTPHWTNLAQQHLTQEQEPA